MRDKRRCGMDVARKWHGSGGKMQAPADTLNYMIAGYAVIFSVNIIYLASLVIRWRNLRQDKELLDQAEKEKNP